MILHVDPHAPILIRGAAAAILYAHIGGAAAGLVSGAAAMAARKGGSLHRAAGNVFFVAILTMAGVGAAVAPFLPKEQAPNTFAGVFTFYLAATGWAAVRRRPGRIGRFEIGAFLVALCAALAGFGWVLASGHAAGAGPAAPVISIFAAIIGLAAAFDLRMILRGGLSGAPRLARHLWRMSLALMIAAGSFAGQPKAVPHFLRGSPLLLLPMLAVFLAMIWWLLRVRSGRAFRAGAGAHSLPPLGREETLDRPGPVRLADALS